MYDVKLIKQPSGRTHQVGGTYQPILDETTGEPEQEYVLVAEVEGHYVPLQSFTTGYVEHQLGRPDTVIEDSSSSGTAQADQPAQPAGEPAAAATPPEGQGTAGEGAAAPQAPADQQAG